MRLAPALLPPLLDLDPDEAFFAGVADDTDQSSAARSLREVFRQAATLGLDGSSLGKCLCSYGLGEAAAAAIAAAWSAQQLASVADAASSRVLQHDDERTVQLLVREATPRPAAQVVGPHGIGQRVRIRPLGWDLVASTDGLASMALPSRCVLTLEVEPDPANWLRTVAR